MAMLRAARELGCAVGRCTALPGRRSALDFALWAAATSAPETCSLSGIQGHRQQQEWSSSACRSYVAQRKRPREKDAGNEVVVEIPQGVACEYSYPNLRLSGPLGVKETNLEIFEHLGIRLAEDGKTVSFASYTPNTTYTFARGPKWRTQKVFHRLNQVARLVERDLVGVTTGYRKDLELRGLGFKWSLAKDDEGADVLTMNIGFSHEVRYSFPPEVKCTVIAPTELFLESCCKDTLGRTTKDLIGLPRRDVYKGKGIFVKGFTPRLK